LTGKQKQSAKRERDKEQKINEMDRDNGRKRGEMLFIFNEIHYMVRPC
jgi:hypothetical protein